MSAETIGDRLTRLDWSGIGQDLSARGYAETPPVLTEPECAQLIASYSDRGRFRHRVEMARHRFGAGDYQYFARPLPALVQALRERCYPDLAVVANRWNELLGVEERYPPTLADFLGRCAAAGQRQPTPLLLHYQTGGYNCLHQDLYGEIAFPIQLVCFLSRPGVDFGGGEFVMVEQRPRAQSAAEVVTGVQGGMVFFTTRVRPSQGSRGHYRVNVRHGVSRIRWGTRFTLGVIFHDGR